MSIFKNIQTRKPKGNKFDLSHEKKMSAQMGKLYPFLTQEIIPGDKFKVNSEVLLRLAPMLSPVMHRVNVYTHYFFVPNRIIWSNWEAFITGGEDGQSTPVFPTLPVNNTYRQQFATGSLADYFGVPTTDDTPVVTSTQINALPFRAYAEIYNEYYRDQNVTEKIDFGKGSETPDMAEIQRLTTIRNRAWEKDYFTSCLPWSQRGGEAQIPLGNVEPKYKNVSSVIDADDPGLGDSVDLFKSTTDTLSNQGGDANYRLENMDTMDVDATTINDLRKANQLQVWLEKSARGGSRYIEQIKSHFGVRSSDARLQRPEYLGGGRQPVVISEVLSTFSNDTVPQGDMTGHGISVGSQNAFNRSFEEHGLVIGIISVLPKSAYQQGLPRLWKKFDKFDYYWPEFAHLGEQEVTTSELYQDWSGEQEDALFGYQQRYAEYKFNNSTVHGDFRTNLQYWHMGRIFANAPVLNSEFIESDPTKRIFNVEDQETDELYIQIYNSISAIRPMPYFSIPEL